MTLALAFSAPSAPTLRPYQVDAIAAVQARWEAGDRGTLLVLATGLGKTVCFAVRGGWEADGVVFNDETRVYAVAIASITAGDKVAEVVAVAKAHYGQLAIFVRYLGLAETL